VSFAARLGLGAVLAAGLVWWLVGAVAASEAAPDPGAAAAVDDPVWIAVPPGLRGEARRVVLLADRDAGEAGFEPLVEVLPNGGIAVRRPAPAPAGPVAAAWPQAGIVLPVDRLGALQPAQRAALLALWSAFSGGKGLGREQLEGRGVALDGDVERLLRWQR